MPRRDTRLGRPRRPLCGGRPARRLRLTMHGRARLDRPVRWRRHHARRRVRYMPLMVYVHMLLHDHPRLYRYVLRDGGQVMNVVLLDHVHRDGMANDYAFAATQNGDRGK